MYIYMFIYIYIYKHVYIDILICIYIYIYIYICVCVYRHTNVYMCIYNGLYSRSGPVSGRENRAVRVPALSSPLPSEPGACFPGAGFSSNLMNAAKGAGLTSTINAQHSTRTPPYSPPQFSGCRRGRASPPPPPPPPLSSASNACPLRPPAPLEAWAPRELRG